MREVSRNNIRLLGDMRRSLAAQDLLLTNARRSLLLTAGLGVQERENSARVLLGLWNESTRVTAGLIVLQITAYCGPVRADRDFPRLFTDASIAGVQMLPPSAG